MAFSSLGWSRITIRSQNRHGVEPKKVKTPAVTTRQKSQDPANMYMKKSVGHVSEMTVGHSLIQVGSGAL